MELTIIKQNGGAYIDSREVAEAIGKQHKNLIRDIENYVGLMRNSNRLKIEPVKFFVENSYRDAKGEVRRCYLLSKLGCELCAHKLTGEKGVLFTAAYVEKYNEMEQRERADIEARAATPRLRVFNTAVKNVLGGFAYTHSSPKRVHDFLRGAYQPFGIIVAPLGDNDHTLTVTDIARILNVYSENGLPHGHAIAAIIDKLDIKPEQIEIAPYGLVGITVRYDYSVLNAVSYWIIENRFPSDVPYLNFEYHIYYGRRLSASGKGDDFYNDEIDLDDEDWAFGDEE